MQPLRHSFLVPIIICSFEVVFKVRGWGAFEETALSILADESPHLQLGCLYKGRIFRIQNSWLHKLITLWGVKTISSFKFSESRDN